MTEAEVRVLITDTVNSKYRSVAHCKDTHKDLEGDMTEVKEAVRSMSNRMWLILGGLMGNFLTIICGMVILYLRSSQ